MPEASDSVNMIRMWLRVVPTRFDLNFAACYSGLWTEKQVVSKLHFPAKAMIILQAPGAQPRREDARVWCIREEKTSLFLLHAGSRKIVCETTVQPGRNFCLFAAES